MYTQHKVHWNTIYNSHDMEATYLLIDRRADKDVVHIYSGILLSRKKEWNNAICSNMGGPGDDHTEWRKSERERQISYDITFMQNLKKLHKWTYLQNRNRLRDIDHKFMITKGKGGGGIN